jgi:spore coat-associated protein N
MDTTATPRSSRRILAPLATLLVAGAIAVGSGASFTSQSANPANVYASGTLTQSNSKAGAAIFNLSNLKPGDTLNGSVTLTNTGSLPATFTLSELDAVNGFVDDDNLQLTITNAGSGAEVFSGTFGTVGSKVLGTFAKNEARTYKFSVQLAATAGNAEQGKSATALYQWDAVQTDAITVDQPAGIPAVDTVANR